MIARSKLIERSLSCLDWGVASFIPVAGPLCAVFALDRFRQVVMNTEERWNPARLHCLLGAGLALLGLLAHGLIAFVVFIKLRQAFANG